MKTVKLNSKIIGGSVVFELLNETIQPIKYFSQPKVKTELKELYKKRYQLNNWRTFDKSVMKKEFGK